MSTISGKVGKKYGLFIPKKAGAPVISKPNIFNDDSEDDDNADTNEQYTSVQSALLQKKKYETKGSLQNQLEIDRALAEDPSCYEYDNVYDQMQESRKIHDGRVKQKHDKKPKYIGQIMKAAEQRKKDYERHVERGIQKEREKEGDQYDDKESFVTGAYKQKMLEMQAEEEREKREAEREAVLDVTRQRDLSGFYRYIYKETTGPDEADTKHRRDDSVKSEDTEHKQMDLTTQHKDREDIIGEDRQVSKCNTARDAKSAEQSHRECSRDTESKSIRKYRSRSRSPLQSHDRHSKTDSHRSKERIAETQSDEKCSHSLKSNSESTSGLVPGQSTYARTTDESTARDARAKYLERKAARRNVAPVISHGEDD